MDAIVGRRRGCPEEGHDGRLAGVPRLEQDVLEGRDVQVEGGGVRRRSTTAAAASSSAGSCQSRADRAAAGAPTSAGPPACPRRAPSSGSTAVRPATAAAATSCGTCCGARDLRRRRHGERLRPRRRACRKTCAQLGLNCGPAGDGCGGTLDCGTCTRPGPAAAEGRRASAAPAGARPRRASPVTAARAADGCGGLLSAPRCTPPEVCGGSVDAGGTVLRRPGDVHGPLPAAGRVQRRRRRSRRRRVAHDHHHAGPSTPPTAPIRSPTCSSTSRTRRCGLHAGRGVRAVRRERQRLAAGERRHRLTRQLHPHQRARSGTNIPLVIQTGRWRRQITSRASRRASTTGCRLHRDDRRERRPA